MLKKYNKNNAYVIRVSFQSLDQYPAYLHQTSVEKDGAFLTSSHRLTLDWLSKAKPFTSEYEANFYIKRELINQSIYLGASFEVECVCELSDLDSKGPH
jgi:hypothetical protein